MPNSVALAANRHGNIVITGTLKRSAFTLRRTEMFSIKTKIIEIGNSQGVRIPLKQLAALAGVSGSSRTQLVGQEIELESTEDGILLRLPRHPRAGWGAKFAQMAAAGDDALLDDIVQTSSWDETEWTW